MLKITKKECESSCEYILPDYLGDIRKVLSVSASATPAGNFVSDGEVHISGIVNYNILYSDAENKLSSIETTSDFDVKAPLDEGFVDTNTDTRVANFGVRVNGPRKITVKSQLKSDIYSEYPDTVEYSGDAFAKAEDLQTLTTVINSENMLFGTLKEREYAEEAEEVAAPADSIEIITSSGLVRIIETIPVDGGVEVKGELIVTAIITTDVGEPFAIKKTVPFDETISIEGGNENMQPSADAYLTSLTVNAVDRGEGSVITVNAISDFTAKMAYNSEVSIIKDAYLKNAKTEEVYSDYSYKELVKSGNAELSFKKSIPRVEIGAENVKEILGVTADARQSGVAIRGGVCTIMGELMFSGVACQINENSELRYIPLKFSAPYELNVNLNCHLPEDTVFEAAVSVADVALYIDSVDASCEVLLKLIYRAYIPKTVKRLSECSQVDALAEDENEASVTVYYPEAGETLFSIAKAFRKSPSDIARDNNLDIAVSADSSNALLSVKKLMIK